MIAVTGANGFVGNALCAALERRRISVRPLLRRSGPGEFRFELCDPKWEENWLPALADCEAVVHCAAHVHRASENRAEQNAFDEINAGGTEHLTKVAETVGVKRFVLVSTMAVYDWSFAGHPRKETSEVAPRTYYAKSKLDAEKCTRSYAGEWSIARLATVFGDGDTANFARLAHALRRRRFILPGRGDARKSVIPVDQAADVLAEIATRAARPPAVINVASPFAPTLGEICSGFCDVCGFPQPISAPVPALRALAVAGDLVQMVVGRSPLTSDNLAKLTTSTVMDTNCLKSLLPDRSWPSFTESLRKHRKYYAAL